MTSNITEIQDSTSQFVEEEGFTEIEIKINSSPTKLTQENDESAIPGANQLLNPIPFVSNFLTKYINSKDLDQKDRLINQRILHTYILPGIFCISMLTSFYIGKYSQPTSPLPPSNSVNSQPITAVSQNAPPVYSYINLTGYHEIENKYVTLKKQLENERQKYYTTCIEEIKEDLTNKNTSIGDLTTFTKTFQTAEAYYLLAQAFQLTNNSLQTEQKLLYAYKLSKSPPNTEQLQQNILVSLAQFYNKKKNYPQLSKVYRLLHKQTQVEGYIHDLKEISSKLTPKTKEYNFTKRYLEYIDKQQ